MKRRSGAQSDPGASNTARTDGSEPETVDIFAGVQRQDISSQTPPLKQSDDLKSVNPAKALSASPPTASNQPEPFLNKLLVKHPHFFWYVAIAILGIIAGILIGRKF